MRVDAVRLPTALAQTTWATILSNLKALGYDSASEKYAVYFDARVAGETCGRGSFWGDSTDSASNWNNTGRMYAVEYDCNEPATLMHEMGHNLGAVQDAAPFSTGSGMHCFEGYDVMCYNDEGSRDPGSIVWNCPTRPDRFDCGHDSYFDAKIGFGEGGGAGSFLDTNWNIGECYVAFVVNYACSNADTTAPAMTSLTRTVASGQQVEAAGRVPVTVNWAAIDAVGVTSYDAYVRAAGGDWESVSSGASTGATRFLAAGTSFEFAVRAFDRAGNTSAWKYLTVPVQAHQETSSAITFYGSWTTAPWAEAFGGSLRFASTTSSWTKLTFTGSQVAWVASKATNRGAAYVWLDDVYQGYVDLYNATTRPRSVVLTKSVDPSRMHTLTIQPIGTSGRPTIDVDAFVVLG